VPHFGLDSWSFLPVSGTSIPRTIRFTPRLILNSVRGAVASAVDGHGVMRAYSYHVAQHVQAGELEILLADNENSPLPIHLITPPGRLSTRKVRAFVDFAVPRLRSAFARLRL
jgi:DNA-binding transcriptional LysR family regulator